MILIKKALLSFVALIIIFIITFNSVSNNNSLKKIRIAFSKASGKKTYELYTKWVKYADRTVECVDLIGLSLKGAVESLEKCDGLILTGGNDVQPEYYNKKYETGRCKTEPYRDTLDFALIKKAAQLKIPVLGICRGQQVLNVAYGGNLIIDIPTDVGKKVKHGNIGNESCLHPINIKKGSVLYGIIHIQTSSTPEISLFIFANSYNLYFRSTNILFS